MQPCYTNEVRFLLPDRYVDRSITGFVIPGGEAGSPIDPEKSGEFSLVLTREAVPPGNNATLLHPLHRIGQGGFLPGILLVSCLNL